MAPITIPAIAPPLRPLLESGEVSGVVSWPVLEELAGSEEESLEAGGRQCSRRKWR